MTTIAADSALAQTEVVDVRPVFPISDQSLWDDAERVRDDLADQIQAAFEQKGMVAWIRKSKPGEYPLLVNVDSWIRSDDTESSVTFDRSSLSISISVSAHRLSPLLYSVDLRRHKKHFSRTHWDLGLNDVPEFVDHLVRGGSKPRFFKERTSALERLVGALLPFVGNERQNDLVREARPKYLTGATICAVAGVFLLLFALAGLPLVGVVGAALVVTAVVISYRRPELDVVPKQPSRSPRNEIMVDSWHVSVPGAGRTFEQFRDRIHEAIARCDPGSDFSLEVHQHRTARGFEERERVVLFRGQATLHVHVYPFADDAFVGWNSYINCTRWAESNPISQTVRDGKRLRYRGLEVGFQIPTHFDLMESDTLAEAVHRSLTEEIKTFLKEREIEADLDFQIIRGDRNQALNEGKEKERDSSRIGARWRGGSFFSRRVQ